MRYYELLVTAMLNKDIPFNCSNEELSNFINIAMLQDDVLKAKHLSKGFKHYNFSSFYPTEKDKVYKKGKIYLFTVRSAEKDFIQKLKRTLKEVKHNGINVIASELKEKKQQFITEINTITPVVVTLKEGKHWQHGEDIELLKQGLHNNLRNKYQHLFEIDLNDNELFFDGIIITNRKSIITQYKGGCLIGNKLKLQIKTDDNSQIIATMCLMSGLGEKNSIGMGFCHAH
ncbi:CRISPR-associated endoribonuclease Cas6 [Clostridium sp.]|jgi:CRISPR-associated endoribonuclease Cas6|uniref:CRISPR-associated endoribonuclease Cas6 n=1 Tax=Clostridium sp. TaxID=1506 RepID=UPI001A3A5010|nr:CRISPR-associated endoribonuclease Cas6 [Clostridium sp.]MBK5236434.1 CRISPR-associated endoribonuclease Cas6 [Clostridium sp.]